jgi:hypothetical protein
MKRSPGDRPRVHSARMCRSNQNTLIGLVDDCKQGYSYWFRWMARGIGTPTID